MAQPHHRGRYQRKAKQVRDAANRDPLTICWACGRTLDAHPPHRSGKPATWHAGHTINADASARPWLNTRQPPPPGAWLAPEASTCNIIRGNNHRVANTGYAWP